MLKLIQFPSAWTLPSMSPFCFKVEMFLKMADLPYKVVNKKHPGGTPKGKLPVLVDGDIKVADSNFIIDYLNKRYELSLGTHLSEQQQALACALRAMIEEHLYFIMVYSRWIDESGKRVFKQKIKKHLPVGLGDLIFWNTHRMAKNQLYQQGIGRHNHYQIYQLGKADIDAIAIQLDAQPFILGEALSSLDATVYAFLFSILHTPIENPLKDCVMSHPNLVEYCEHLRERFWS